mmetsp:Transcript_16725/g.35186  ORF Transcript_16725/g.35186 Transcript_16725/m.35186 type:complete len:82 (-) Transcript_16725:286-531(-)
MPFIMTFLACGPKEKWVPGRSTVHMSHSMVMSSALMKMGESFVFGDLERDVADLLRDMPDWEEDDDDDDDEVIALVETIAL